MTSNLRRSVKDARDSLSALPEQLADAGAALRAGVGAVRTTTVVLAAVAALALILAIIALIRSRG